ncbi:3-isopropylmalate dehydratase [Rhodovulum sp. 12E13]|uniref:LeuD/DmdB family oxidoreductase small subunit n=1 Tax=Rhodovulum sp. 12E13 TaxID=2203891 RepID=UPI000E170522|nr:3-isopropylmalate dehydratase [Rhodovulum sp. 12E13]RDC75217.1 3-isopropylmalate dehydratase [Rhodovulum sp. 12E13]
MTETQPGRVWLFGDDIDTDQLAPGRYMRGGIEQLAAHCLEAARPDFAAGVRPGDILVAGKNFGMGSSREQAAEALRHLGLAGVVARSFAGIFYRNAINLGLPVLTAPDLAGVADGDRATLAPETGMLRLTEKGIDIPTEPIPENLRGIIADGGLVPHLKKRFAAAP